MFGFSDALFHIPMKRVDYSTEHIELLLSITSMRTKGEIKHGSRSMNGFYQQCIIQCVSNAFLWPSTYYTADHSIHGAITRSCFNDGPPFSTLAQHWNSIVRIPRGCWDISRSWLTVLTHVFTSPAYRTSPPSPAQSTGTEIPEKVAQQLGQCWANVFDVGSALDQRWASRSSGILPSTDSMT